MTQRHLDEQEQRERHRKPGEEQEAPATPAPAVSWQALQRSIGNQGVRHLVEGGRVEGARREALSEAPAPLPEAVREGIAGVSGVGRQLDAETRAEMEPRLGKDLSGVRLHEGPEADSMSRRLGARAFTQGRDVFLSRRSRGDTLAHELSHVGQDAPGSATAHLQTDTETKPEADEEEEELPQVSMALEGPGGKPVTVKGKRKKLQTLDEFYAGPKGPKLDPKVEAMIEGTYDPKRDDTYEEKVEKQFDQQIYDETQRRKQRAAMVGQTPGPRQVPIGGGWSGTREWDPGDLYEPTEGVANLFAHRATFAEESVTSEPSRGGAEEVDPNKPLPTIAPKVPAPAETPKPVEPFVPQTFNIDLTIDNIKKEFHGLTAEGATIELKREWLWCRDLIELYRKWHQELRDNRYNHRIVGWISDRLGGHGDPPPMEIWNIVENRLNRVGSVLQKSPDQLKVDFEKHLRDQAENEKQIEEQRLSMGLTSLSKFKSYDPREKYHAWESFMEGHIRQATQLLQDAAEAIEAQRKGVFYYKEGTIAGAESGLKIAKEVQKWDKRVASLIPVPGGALGAAAWNAAFTGVTEFAGQASEMHYGLRDEFDFSTIGKDMLKDGVTAYVSGVAAGKLTKVFGGYLRKRIAAKLGVELSEVALGKVQQWLVGTVAGVAVSPLNAPVRQVMEYHLGQRDRISVEDMVRETVENLPETLLMAAVGSAVGTAHGGEPGGPEPVGKKTAAPEAPAPVIEPTSGPVAETATPTVKPVAEATPAPVPEPTAAPVAESVAAPKAAVTPSAPVEAPAAPAPPIEAPVTSAPKVAAHRGAKPPPIPKRALAPRTARRGRGDGGGKKTATIAEPTVRELAVGDKRTVRKAITEDARATTKEPTADELAVGDRRTTTRAIDENARPSDEVAEPTADELAVGDRRTTTRAIDENARPSDELTEPTADELAVGDRRTTTRAVPEDTAVTEETPVAERPTERQEAVPGPEEPIGEVYGPVEPGIKPLPDETVIQLENGWHEADARRVYDRMVAETRNREAALYYNPETGQYIIVQGNEGTAAVQPGEGPVAGKAQRWKEILETRDGGRWELQNHSHPNGQRGVVDPVNQMASGAGGDMMVVAGESIAAGGQPRSSVIDYMTADGPKQTRFGFDPNSERPFWLELPDGAPRLEFRTIEAYHAYLATNFPGQVAFHPIPEWLSGSNPVQHARQAAHQAEVAQRTTQVVDTQATTQQMPSQRTTDIMGADATTQQMPSERPTRRIDTTAHQGTTQRIGETTTGQPTGRMQAQGEFGQPPPMPGEGPGGGGPGGGRGRGAAGPQEVLPIDNEIEANQVLHTQVQARRPIRLLPNHEDVVDAWRNEYGQTEGEVPPAWLDQSGKLVVDASRVKTIGVLYGPVPAPRARGGPGGETMGTEPPRSRTDGGYEEQALPPWEPRQYEPPRVETRIDDADEAASAYYDRDANDPANPPGMTFDPKTYQANWELAGGKGEAPPAWIDQYDRLNVDATRVNVYEGPVPTGRGRSGEPGPGGGPATPVPGGMAPRAAGGGGENEGPLGPAKGPEGGGVVAEEVPDSAATTQRMGRVSAADISRRRAQGLRYIRDNDVRFYHATNRAIVRLMQRLQSSGIPWESEGGGLWLTTDPTSPFFSEGQISVNRTRQIYERYGVPWDGQTEALAAEPVFFEVNLEALPSPSGAGDVMAEFAADAPGRSRVATDFQVRDLTGPPLSAMQETTSLRGPGQPQAGAGSEEVVITDDEQPPIGGGAPGAPQQPAPLTPLPPVLPEGGAGPAGRGGPSAAGPVAWGLPSREVSAQIRDPHVAAQLFIEQVRGGNPNARAIRNADMVAAAWRYTYRQYTDPPLAWLDGNGNIVLDGTRVDPRIAPGYGRGGAGF